MAQSYYITPYPSDQGSLLALRQRRFTILPLPRQARGCRRGRANYLDRRDNNILTLSRRS